MDGRSVLVTVCVGLCAVAAVVDSEPTAERVCNSTDIEIVTITNENRDNVIHHKTFKCLQNFKLKCPLFYDYYADQKNKTQSQNITEYKSCNAYESIKNGTECRLNCTQENCTLPEDCNKYKAKKVCPLEKFGFDCVNRCQCQNNATCDSRDGSCPCLTRLKETKCDHPCLLGYYGDNCVSDCKCYKNAKCDTKTGKCFCKPGYTGNFCEKTCPPGYYGVNCKNLCECKNNATCNAKNGDCFCLPGYEGKLCEKTCSEGFYGTNCKLKCTCLNGAMCDPVNGTCSCSPGFMGDHCEFLCPKGSYGHQCQHKCQCLYDAICDSIHGCLCPNYYEKKFCLVMNNNISKHDIKLNITKNNNETFYGCNWNTNKNYNNITNVCFCLPGFTGYDCTKDCPFGKFGLNCSYTCDCQNEASCRSTDGVCLCAPGFYGSKCAEFCPKNYYGTYCLHKCNCDPKTEICDHIKGCIFNNNSLKNDKDGWFQSPEFENEIVSSWLVLDVSIVLTLMIFTMLCAGLLICYYYYFSYQLLKVNQRYRHSFDLQENTFNPDEQDVSFGINNTSGISIEHINNSVFNFKQKISYTNEIFYSENSSVSNFQSENKEHVYLEIDENFFKQRQDDLYDHLDFLRPTGSWKPHYQKALVSPEHSRSSSNSEDYTT